MKTRGGAVALPTVNEEGIDSSSAGEGKKQRAQGRGRGQLIKQARRTFFARVASQT